VSDDISDAPDQPEERAKYDLLDSDPSDEQLVRDQVTGIDWPVRVAPRLPESTPFPTESFPGWMRDFIKSWALQSQTPEEMGACISLVCVAAACAGNVEVSPWDGWVEGTNLYVTVVMPPGSKKTPTLKAMRAPLKAWEEEVQKQAKVESAKNAQLRKIREKQVNALSDAAVKAESDEADEAATAAADAAADLAQFPVLNPFPQILCGDATPEALAELLQNNGERIAMICDEGGPFSQMAGQYSGGQPNTDIYAKAYSNEEHTVNRRTSSTLSIKRPYLTIGITTQPWKLGLVMSNDALVGAGIIDRFLISRPRNLVGYEQVHEMRDVATSPEAAATRERYAERFLALIRSLDFIDRVTLSLSDEALERFMGWMAATNPLKRPGRDYEHIAGAVSKADGQLLRVAAILHVAATFDAKEGGLQQPISLDTMERAIELIDYFINERARHSRSSEPGQVLSAARTVLLKLREKPASFFKGKVDGLVSLGKLTDKCALPRDSLDQERVLDVLIGRGWLRIYEPPPTPGGARQSGRPTRYFYVHPDLRS
jgi:replicative DNA helicase